MIDDVWDNTDPDNLEPINDGDTTKDKTPVIGGEGEPGNTIIVIIDDEVVGSTIVGEDGKWTFEPEDELTEGDHKFEVIERDPAGNESDPSDPVTVIVDTTPPDAPKITSVYDDVGDWQGELNPGDVTDDANPTVRGTAEPYSLVTLYDGDRVVGSARADAEGNWEITTDTLLTGPHSLTAKATDAAGNVSEPSESFDFSLVTGGAPAAPVIVNVIDNEGDITGNISPGGSTDDTRPTIVGTAQPGALVRIYDVVDGQEVELGSVVADAETGRWEFRPDAEHALSEGQHNLKATAELAGNVSPETGLYPIEVDLTAPEALRDLELIDDVGDVQGPITSGTTTDDDRPTFQGNGAEPGATIIIRDNGVVIGSTTVKPDGTWSFEPETPLADGPHSFTAQPVDAVGNKGPESAPIDFIVDTSDVEISISSVLDDVGAITGPITPGGVTDDTMPTVVGRATPDCVVNVYDGDTLLGTAIADGKGDWTFEVPAPGLSEGKHTLHATVISPAGNESKPVSFDLEVDTTAPDVGEIVDVLDDVGQYQGTIEPGTPTDDPTPTLVGKAEPGSVVFVRDGDRVIGSTTTDGDGNWRFTPANPLADGRYDFNIVVRDEAGNESQPSPTWPVIVDTTAPVKPVIEDIWDNTDPGNLVPIGDGDTTQDKTPVIGGEGEPGNTIIVIIDDEVVGSTIVDEDGKWTFEPEDELTDGGHKFEVIERDEAGNESERSDPVTVIVGTNPPLAQATVESMGKDSGSDRGDFLTNDGSAGRLIQGSLTAALAAGEKVQVSTDNGRTWLDAIVGADGKWMFVDTNAHSSSFEIQTRVVNRAGEDGGISTQAVTLDTSVAPPSSLSFSGQQGTVTFSPAELAGGGKLVIDYGGGNLVERALTQAEISSGRASFAAQGSTAKAALVDAAGNISDFRASSVSAFSKVEDFNSAPQGVFNTIKFDGFYLTSIVDNHYPAFPQQIGMNRDPNISMRPSTPALEINGAVLLDFRNQSLKTTSISFDIGDITNTRGSFSTSVAVYYSDGTIDTEAYHSRDGIFRTFSVDVSGSGKVIDTVSINNNQGGDEYIWVDNIRYSGYESNTWLEKPLIQQSVTNENGYYGDDENNIFLVDNVSIFNSNATSVNGNGGIDTLKLTGAGQVLDLSNLQGKLASIEVIDLTGTGGNTLKLSLGDVLEQGGQSLFIKSDTTQMLVRGGEGDKVELSDLLPDGTDVGDWAQLAGQVTLEGVSYNVFHHSGLNAEVLVQTGVETQLNNH
ncbi:Ig-like domain-containing protein [Burkholderia ubonensis]|uniref:Ig-like domain-containing protein n=1 Tax=Burkholderia ubonensis TaxID=101571 RepID=UPI001E2E387B|nr:Ig-like domain-containing protein [Burkholderia ubonensis]